MRSMRRVANILFCLAVSGMLAGVQPASAEGTSHAAGDAPHTEAEVSPVCCVDWPQEVAQSMKSGSGDGFAVRLKGLEESQIQAAASAVNQTYADNRATAFAWLESLTAALTKEGAYAAAATLLYALDVPDDIWGLERGVFQHWIGQGSDGLQALLERWARGEDGADRAISVVAALYQDEYVDRFDAYLAWIDKSEVPFRGVLLQNLMPHLLRPHFDMAQTLIVPHLDDIPFNNAFYILTERRAEEDALATLKWVSKIPVPHSRLGVKMEAFGLVIGMMAREDLDVAEALLKQPSFVATYFPAERVQMTNANGDWSQLACWFHDQSWRQFIEAALDSDLKRAEEASLRLCNPQLLKDYREFFRDNF